MLGQLGHSNQLGMGMGGLRHWPDRASGGWGYLSEHEPEWVEESVAAPCKRLGVLPARACGYVVLR